MNHTRVRIPEPLRSLAGGTWEIRVGGQTVGELLGGLKRDYGDLADRILDPAGEPQRVHLFVGTEPAEGRHTEIADGAVVTIVPEVSGGASRGPGLCSEHGLA